MHPAVWLVPLLPVAVGTVLGVVGTLWRRRTRGWARTTGVVTTRDGGLQGIPAAYPTFMWQDAHGTWHRRTSMMRGGFRGPGSQVPVLYDPAFPSHGQIDTAAQNGTVLAVVGWIVAGVGGAVALGIVTTVAVLTA